MGGRVQATLGLRAAVLTVPCATLLPFSLGVTIPRVDVLYLSRHRLLHRGAFYLIFALLLCIPT